MKKVLLGFLMFTVTAFLAMPVHALPFTDYVDIGDPVSEAGHNMVGWGPVEPATHGGTWGTPADGTARVISSQGQGDWASIDLMFNGIGLSMLHLEGIATDSFYVYIDADTSIDAFQNYVAGNTAPSGWAYYYDPPDSSSEVWITTSIDTGAVYGTLYGTHTITLLSDQPHWSSWGTYGQVAFSSIAVEPVPEPATMLLLGSGLIGLAGFRRRFVKRGRTA